MEVIGSHFMYEYHTQPKVTSYRILRYCMLFKCRISG